MFRIKRLILSSIRGLFGIVSFWGDISVGEPMMAPENSPESNGKSFFIVCVS